MTCFEGTDFNRVDQHEQGDSGIIDLERVRWTIIISGLLFFALFGFASEAVRNYNKCTHKLFLRKRKCSKVAPIPMSRAPSSKSSVGFYGSGKSDTTLVVDDDDDDDDVLTISRTKVIKEQRHSTDTESNLTRRMDSPTLELSVEGTTTQSMIRSDADSDDDDDGQSTVQSEAHTSMVDSISVYSQPSPRYPSSPVLPPASSVSSLAVPPCAFLLNSQRDYDRRDFYRQTSSLSSRNQNHYHYPQRPYHRTPPRQRIPISVAPTPEGSFLDLQGSIGSAI